ncbi:hypothetical protein PTSG_11626 [Salpingoeca rosetta]|uniref:Uncharacterized protein n=1 Tax=Salpingoeca rosetta (strain ATCC 50818 / BSB-021) TaxID=946362 RepID=F2TX48_SALR5|nr:uncharacterized protein PTSG_11626 [Salpingoeca rosetta]EGD75957.1 hypothetical protein PTSG_11626 [Salpingoeca rosetta]|eukprot:XP_004998133.1 hypothetical protein PTSG_11626 [Salpingoeca rosetta]
MQVVVLVVMMVMVLEAPCATMAQQTGHAVCSVEDHLHHNHEVKCSYEHIERVRATNHMALVIDVGRAATTFHVLDIQTEGEHVSVTDLTVGDSGQVNTDLVFQMSITHFPESKYPAFVQCLLNVSQHIIKPKYHRHTTLFIHGTGGVRLLTQYRQDEFVEITRNVFSASDFIVRPQHIDVIQGGLEAVYTWISGNLDRRDASSAGVMDIGGASVQMAFDISETKLAGKPLFPDSFLFHTRLRGQHRRLFASSFNDVGLEAVRCRLAAFNSTTSPDSAGGGVDPCQSHHGQPVDFHACTQAIQRILNSSIIEIAHFRMCNVCEAYCYCSLSGVAQPRITSDLPFTFYGGLSQVTAAINWGPGVTLQSIQDHARRVCARETSPTPDAATGVRCSDFIYAYELLVTGFGFSASAGADVLFFRDIPSGWIRGSVFTAAQNSASSSVPYLNPAITAVTVLACLMVVVLGVTCVCIRKDEASPILPFMGNQKQNGHTLVDEARPLVVEGMSACSDTECDDDNDCDDDACDGDDDCDAECNTRDDSFSFPGTSA